MTQRFTNSFIFKAVLILFLSLFISTGSRGQEPVKIKLTTPQDRARYYHYMALKQLQKGRVIRAVLLLNRAVMIYSDNEYLIDLASIYERQGKYRHAYNIIDKIEPHRKDRPISRVVIANKKASYASYMGLNLEAHEGNGKALRLMNLYQIDSLSLRSDLMNNYGVSRMLYQTVPGTNAYISIHKRDLQDAREYVLTSVKLNPNNCVAKYNLEFINTLLSELEWDSIKTVPAYPTSELIERITSFPDLECPIPQPEYKEEIIKSLKKEKEIVLILDVSGSMSYPAPDGRPRIDVMKELALQILDELDEAVDIGLLTLGGEYCDASPSHRVSIVEKRDRSELKAIVNNLQLDGCTPLNNRLRQAVSMFSNRSRDNRKAIFLLSDGMHYCCENPRLNLESTCEVAKEVNGRGVKIHVFSLLADNSENGQQFAIYNCMAMLTEGRVFSMQSTDLDEQHSLSMTSPIYALPIKKDDLMSGRYIYPDFRGDTIWHQNN